MIKIFATYSGCCYICIKQVTKSSSLKHLLILCRVVKLADAPPCLGGGEYGKPVRANYSLKVRLLPLQQ